MDACATCGVTNRSSWCPTCSTLPCRRCTCWFPPGPHDRAITTPARVHRHNGGQALARRRCWNVNVPACPHRLAALHLLVVVEAAPLPIVGVRARQMRAYLQGGAARCASTATTRGAETQPTQASSAVLVSSWVIHRPTPASTAAHTSLAHRFMSDGPPQSAYLGATVTRKRGFPPWQQVTAQATRKEGSNVQSNTSVTCVRRRTTSRARPPNVPFAHLFSLEHAEHADGQLEPEK